jgi:ubiquinone/menaquinone biosynthesis C-methylase UbiE
MMHKLLRAGRLAEDRVRQILHLNESETKLARDAQKFWTRPPTEKNNVWWHWRGSGVYSDQQWLAIGKKHLDLYRKWERMLGITEPLKKVVDWGCGGGANAVAFAPECETFYGVEPSADALKETEKQLATTGSTARFMPVQLDITKPEDTLNVIPHDIDLFYCLYVYEVFPSKEYGQRILQLGADMLKPGGCAYIQIKYTTDSWTTRSRRWGYTRGVASMVSYRLDECWEMGEKVGLVPEAMHLVPRPEEVPDFRYAYYLFRKPLVTKEAAPARPAVMREVEPVAV